MTFNNYVYRTDNCIWRVVDDKVIILSKDGKYLHSLNEVGSLIWEKADGSLTISKIVEHICSEFNIDNETAKHDVKDFIQTLSQKKLLILHNKK